MKSETSILLTILLSYGIIGIRERADYLKRKETIIGTPDKGTTVRVRIPLLK
jgi:signal transduction histidine kinase